MNFIDGYKTAGKVYLHDEWDVGSLLEIATISMGQSPDGSSYNENGVGVPLFNGPTEFGRLFPTGVKQWTTAPTKCCEAGDILFCVRGSTTGRMNIADQKYCLGRGLAAIRGNKEGNTRFIYYLINHYIDNFLAFSAGSTFPNVSRDNIAAVCLPLPPLIEQKKIAEILSTVDEHISETEGLIEKTKTLKQGMMQRLLTKGIGHTEFKETEIGRIPASWEVLGLERAAKIIMGQSPNSGSYNTTGKGLPFYQGKADFGDKYPITRVWCSESIKIAPPDSILISVRAPVGSINLSQVKSCIGRGLAAIVVEDARTRAYLYFYLQFFASKFEKVSQGSTFTAINSGDLYGFLVATPCIAEQEKISSMLSEIDAQIDAYKCKLDTLTRLKSGLMQQLLTGRIRVKV